MTPRRSLILLCLAIVTCALVAVGGSPRAEEGDESELPPVSESELDLYIKVYGAMLADHDLTIETAIQPHHITLDAFRQIERRIQTQPRMVERVRDALIEQAKSRSAFAAGLATPRAGDRAPGGAAHRIPTPK